MNCIRGKIMGALFNCPGMWKSWLRFCMAPKIAIDVVLPFINIHVIKGAHAEFEV